FSSDLDKTTKAMLDQGVRIVETIKQPLYQPLPVEYQVVTVFAVIHKFLASVPVKKVKEWQKLLINFLEVQHPAIIQAIRDTKDLDDKTAEGLKTAIEEFKRQHEVGE
ncbi:MAG: F0F1 ATP synthase subunit alpha, partial [Hyphomonadaceae bacterium]|nr:F0F1 ATP synthase subunit alpha [Clostridia bacterium]